MMSINHTSLLRESATPIPCYLLVVDDEALIRAEYASFFKRAGYQVHSANSGAQALMMIGVRPYQIVVIDWDMPRMDGPSLCRKIRLEEGDQYTYLMILSVRTSMADILVGLEAGADDYFVKGSPSEELLARIAAGRRITAVEHLLHASSGENRSESETDRSTEVHASSVKSSWSSCPRLRWVKPR